MVAALIAFLIFVVAPVIGIAALTFSGLMAKEFVSTVISAFHLRVRRRRGTASEPAPATDVAPALNVIAFTPRAPRPVEQADASDVRVA